ncbi:septal ring lytic transglycosylase RlpA family protein [bacterium]|nr:septal ring lytic transglycosylase RlpA family protein [bacterium]
MASRILKERLVFVGGVLCALLVILTACGLDGEYASVVGPDGRTVKFRATGEASWYGPGFAGRPTASGEIFNPDQLTAAHGNIPLGSVVRVTNLENGRSVVVRVNDRFPGTKGRIIDLSRASFASLAPVERGVIPVRLEVLQAVH